MKLASYDRDGTASYGVVTAEGICDVPTNWPAAPPTVLAAIEDGESALSRIADLPHRAQARIGLDDVLLFAPIPNPPKLLGLAVNYAAHHRESSRQALPDDPRRNTTPRPFLMPATAICHPGTEIPWPAYSEQIDYEVELAAVIGVTTKCVSPADAKDCIVAYTIANDVSARSVTHSANRAERDKDAFFDWLHGKWADSFCPTGPWLVTADEIGDPGDLDVALTVNGRPRQQANTSQMIFDVYELVSFISHLMTLSPGDIIATGTPSGVGMATGEFLEPGDVITCRIEKIGELTNTLGPRPQTFYTPCSG